MKYLRSKNNGIVFDYSERLAANPNIEVITEREAFPEKFTSIDLKTRPITIKLDVPEEVVAKPEVSPELATQRGITFAGANIKATKTKKRSTLADFVGLVGDA